MKLRAKEFYPGKDGALKAQVQVLDQDEDPITVLFEDTITLTSAKSRETFAKEIIKRCGEHLNGATVSGLETHLLELKLKAEEDLKNPPQAETTQRVGPYFIRYNCLWHVKPTMLGDVDEMLCNFTAMITEQRLEDDGAESRRIVTLQAKLAGKPVPPVSVSMAEFFSLNGLLHHLGTEATVSPGPLIKDRIRHAIQLFSQEEGYPNRHVFTHLGWRQIESQWIYLHAGGALGGTDIEVAPDEALQRYHLPPQRRSLKKAVSASLQIQKCGPSRVTVPLLAMVYLAPLAEWLHPDFTTWLEGPSGARKSSLAAVVMSHYGTFDRGHPPASWEDSANSLEKLAFLAKDTVLWIDDFAPPTTAASARELELKAHRVIRAQGNLTGRRRMRSDTSLRPAYHPRGLILSTGELRPSGQSTVARMLQLDVAPGEIDLEELTIAQQQLSYLPHAMTGYLQWLQPQLETGPARWRSRWEALRTEQQADLTNHARHPEMYAHLLTGWKLFLAFAVDAGALAQGEAGVMKQEGGTFIAEALNRQRIDNATEDPVQRFLGIVREAFAQKRVYLSSVDGDRPAQAEQWGWVRVPVARNEGTTAESVQPAPNAVLLSWVDEHFIYLLPDSAYRLAYASLQQAGTILLPQPTLWKRLVQQEYVQRGARHYAREKRIQGVKHYVLFLGREKFLHATESLISGESDDSDDSDDN